MVQRILNEEHEALLAEERRLLGDLRAALARFDATEEDQQTLADAVARLDELFLVVVAGEFNAGKSAFVNALLGKKILAEGPTPTTSRIHLLRWGAESKQKTEGGIEVIEEPLPILSEIHLVDTPGTNAIEREHEAITRRFVPNSDLVLFVTSADRPFTESERAFLEQIRDWGKKVVFVLNKVDTILEEEDVQRVEAYVADNAKKLLGRAPVVFPVSARQALAAKVAVDDAERDELAAASRFAALEEYVVSTLDEAERVRLKLSSPLGVGEHLAERYREVVGGRLELLADDLAALDDVESQLAGYREDLEREFTYRLADVEKVLSEVENRGVEFFDDTLRLGRVFDLLNRNRIKNEYTRRVLADAPRQIEAKVQGIIDWLVSAELRQWQAVVDHVSKRKDRYADRIVGQTGGSFDYDRARLLETVGGTARRTVEGFDHDAEAQRLADSVQGAVAGAAVLEVSAVGLGATIAAVATSTAADVTGILAATTLAVLGLAVIPAKRAKAKKELRAQIADLRRDLLNALHQPFEAEVDRSLSRLREAIAPYTRFVRAEQEKLDDQKKTLAELTGQLDELRGRIERLA